MIEGDRLGYVIPQWMLDISPEGHQMTALVSLFSRRRSSTAVLYCSRKMLLAMKEWSSCTVLRWEGFCNSKNTMMRRQEHSYSFDRVTLRVPVWHESDVPLLNIGVEAKSKTGRVRGRRDAVKLACLSLSAILEPLSSST